MLATLFAALACGLTAASFAGSQGLLASVVASAVSLFAAVLVTLVLSRVTNVTVVVLAGTFLRLSLTLGLGFAVAAKAGLWNDTYFLTLGVVYVANLAVETWLAYEQNRSVSRIRPTV